MKTTEFLTVEEVIKLHGMLIERFGGTGTLRDRGMLESALARPRSGYYRSLSEQAGALLQSLALNHAFLDGNKRVAFAASAIFLRMNGFGLIVDADEGETFMIRDVIQRKADLEEITLWLEKRMVKK